LADIDGRHDRSYTAVKPPEDNFSPRGGYDILMSAGSHSGTIIRENHLGEKGYTFHCTMLYETKKVTDLPARFVMAQHTILFHNMAYLSELQPCRRNISTVQSFADTKIMAAK
jgi:hypothetical protein